MIREAHGVSAGDERVAPFGPSASHPAPRGDPRWAVEARTHYPQIERFAMTIGRLWNGQLGSTVEGE
jgi:hypothetical protein